MAARSMARVFLNLSRPSTPMLKAIFSRTSARGTSPISARRTNSGQRAASCRLQAFVSSCRAVAACSSFQSMPRARSALRKSRPFRRPERAASSRSGYGMYCG